MNFIKTDDAIIIKRDIVFTKGQQLIKYNTNHRGLMTKVENNDLIVNAFIQSKRIRDIYEKLGDSDDVIESEKISWRTFYKSITLAYLSPKIINALIDGKLNMPLRDLYELASKSQDFAKQEQLFKIT